jgi:hypothetical protein
LRRSCFAAELNESSIGAVAGSAPRDKRREMQRRTASAVTSSRAASAELYQSRASSAGAHAPAAPYPRSKRLRLICPFPAVQKNCFLSARTTRASRRRSAAALHISSMPRATSLPRCCAFPVQAATQPASPSPRVAIASGSVHARSFFHTLHRAARVQVLRVSMPSPSQSEITASIARIPHRVNASAASILEEKRSAARSVLFVGPGIEGTRKPSARLILLDEILEKCSPEPQFDVILLAAS